ncbi:MAG: hypothetical protein JNK31_07290 [Candidatus Competibacter sp.]|nr:hypothetical protein [Candidatus Competibacter sp.]
MRTTVDLPDELFRQAKARAALEGVRLRDLVEKGVRLALAAPLATGARKRVEFPLHCSLQPKTLSIEEVYRADEQARLEEDASLGGALRR